MKKISFFWLCCLLFLAGGTSVFAQTKPEDDEFLQLLRQEVQWQYDSLQHTNQPPYFLAYRVNETTEHSISANFGGIYDNSISKSVVLTIEMRVGTSENDNYHYLTHQNTFVRQIPLPLNENPNVVRKILRDETQKAYQDAVIQSVENKVTLTLQVGENDYEKLLYMPGDMDGYYEPAINSELHWNETEIKHRLMYCTTENNLEVTEKSAKLNFLTSRKYLVNSKKSYFVQNSATTTLTLRVAGLTSDNIPEHIERQYFANFPDQLPDANVLDDVMLDMEIWLSNLFFAENSDAFRCPVLFSPDAAAVLVHNLIGHELENADNSIFRNKIGQQVLPESFTVYSDPTISNTDGNYYGGHYLFDDEGVKGSRVTHIALGELQNLLAMQTQQPNAYQSNGHARGNRLLPTARQSNLFLISSKTLEESQLKELLSNEVSQQKLDYALYVKEVEIRCDTNDMVTVYPTLCYKTYPKQHKDEFVRDVVLIGSKQEWINNLIAAGGESGCMTMICHTRGDDLLTSCSSPALLFRSVEARQQAKVPHPRIRRPITITGGSVPMATAEVFTQSAKNEWETDVETLKIGEETAPYYEEFLMTDARIFTVEAAEGSVFYSNEKPVRQFVPKILLGSDLFNSDNLYEERASDHTQYLLPFQNSVTFVHDFMDAADAEYQKALKQWKAKQTLQPTPKSHPLPDRSAALPTQSDDEQNFEYSTLNNLEHLACEVSAELANHDFLSRSGANIYIMQGNAYFWNSENTTYSRPISVIGLQLCGTVKAADGQDYSDSRTLFMPCTDSLFSHQIVQREMGLFVSHMKNVNQQGKRFSGCYMGPILVESEAVGDLMAAALFDHLLAYRVPASRVEETSGLLGNPLDYQLDRIVTSKKVTVTANKSGDGFDKSAFVRHEKTDAEGVEVQETEIIRDGELITLMGNRNVTVSTPYSNGFQQLAIHDEGCFGTRGAGRIDFSHKNTVPHGNLKKMLLKEAKKQGAEYAYILRQSYDGDNMRNNLDSMASWTQLLQLYQVDVRTGEEVPVVGAYMIRFNFFMLNDILAVSNRKAAFPVMVKVRGVSGSRDFPFAGVPTCIVAPDGLLLQRTYIVGGGM